MDKTYEDIQADFVILDEILQDWWVFSIEQGDEKLMDLAMDMYQLLKVHRADVA